jgi:hypothetical protein
MGSPFKRKIFVYLLKAKETKKRLLKLQHK